MNIEPCASVCTKVSANTWWTSRLVINPQRNVDAITIQACPGQRREGNCDFRARPPCATRKPLPASHYVQAATCKPLPASRAAGLLRASAPRRRSGRSWRSTSAGPLAAERRALAARGGARLGRRRAALSLRARMRRVRLRPGRLRAVFLVARASTVEPRMMST